MTLLNFKILNFRFAAFVITFVFAAFFTAVFMQRERYRF